MRSFQGQRLYQFSEFKFGEFSRFGESGRNARFESAMLVRGWRDGIAGREDGRALICRNHEERWPLPWRNFRAPPSELAHPAKEPVPSIPSAAPPPRPPPFLHLPLVLSHYQFFFPFSFFSLYFSFYAAGIKTKGNSRKKNRNLLRAGDFFQSTLRRRLAKLHRQSVRRKLEFAVSTEYRKLDPD